MTPDPLPMVLRMLSEFREDEPIVETVHLPVDPAKAVEFRKLLDDLMAAMHKASGLREARTHTPAPDSNEYLIYDVWNDRAGLRRWWEGALLRTFQTALHDSDVVPTRSRSRLQPAAADLIGALVPAGRIGMKFDDGGTDDVRCQMLREPFGEFVDADAGAFGIWSMRRSSALSAAAMQAAK
jgi:quinol monooxygenase YgiN